MNPRLTSVQVLPNFRLSLVFNNGENRLFDVGSYVKKHSCVTTAPLPGLTTKIFAPIRSI